MLVRRTDQMTKANAIKVISGYGKDARFVANVIQSWHRNATRKLCGLADLLAAGHEVRTAQFSVDVLVIDGKRYGWEVLEAPALVQRWTQFAPVA